MKKITVLLIICLIFANVAFAKPGDIAGYIYSTDIVAYIDGMAVPSYNIGGKTVVIAEELEPYGFEVIWSEENREICVYTKEMPENKPLYIPEKSKVSGKIVGRIYETDIKAYTNGMITESYNIGGRTALVVEDMASTDDDAKRMSRDSNPHRSIGYSVSLMKFVWNETDRTISLFTVRPGSKLMTDYGEVTVKNASQSAYHNGAYSFYTVDDERLAYWVSTILYNDDAYISLADLFTCPEEDIGRALLDLAEKDGTGPTDPSEKSEMEAAFRLEYLTFSQDRLWIKFPQGTLPSQEYSHLVSVELDADCKVILHPWSIPHHSIQ